jgi:hypothetical protein
MTRHKSLTVVPDRRGSLAKQLLVAATAFAALALAGSASVLLVATTLVLNGCAHEDVKNEYGFLISPYIVASNVHSLSCITFEATKNFPNGHTVRVGQEWLRHFEPNPLLKGNALINDTPEFGAVVAILPRQG